MSKQGALLGSSAVDLGTGLRLDITNDPVFALVLFVRHCGWRLHNCHPLKAPLAVCHGRLSSAANVQK